MRRPWKSLRRHAPSETGRRARRAGACAILGVLLLAASPVAALKMRPAEIQEGYRSVLRQLASGDEAAALDGLFELETRALGEYPRYDQVERFWRLKLKVISELKDRGGVDQLLPIVVLHHDASEMYRARGKGLLVAHSMTMAIDLAEYLAESAEERTYDRFAGSVLASFGAGMQASRSVQASARALSRALDLSPEIPFALLALAAAHERYGDYEESIPILERLLRVDPEHHHARLRLGVTQLRLGLHDSALRTLEPLLGEGPETWIRSVAFQETARAHQKQGHGDRAESVLRHAVEALPGDQQVAVMLAAHLDAARQPRAARAVLENLAADGSAVRSPRYRYDEWPTEGLAEVRAMLHEQMESRLPQLASSLGAAPPEVSP